MEDRKLCVFAVVPCSTHGYWPPFLLNDPCKYKDHCQYFYQQVHFSLIGRVVSTVESLKNPLDSGSQFWVAARERISTFLRAWICSMNQISRAKWTTKKNLLFVNDPEKWVWLPQMMNNGNHYLCACNHCAFQ